MFKPRAALRFLAICAFTTVPLGAAADPTLLMAEEAGCVWCAKWHEEIGPIYPKTAEGQAVALQRYDLHGEAPDVTFARSVQFTPTFILIKNGVEVGRIEGYPGEDFFWGLLSVLLERAEIPLEQES